MTARKMKKMKRATGLSMLLLEQAAGSARRVKVERCVLEVLDTYVEVEVIEVYT